MKIYRIWDSKHNCWFSGIMENIGPLKAEITRTIKRKENQIRTLEKLKPTTMASEYEVYQRDRIKTYIDYLPDITDLEIVEYEQTMVEIGRKNGALFYPSKSTPLQKLVNK